MRRLSRFTSRRTLAVVVISCVCAWPSELATQQASKIVGARLRTPQPFNCVRIPDAQKAAVTATMKKLYDIVRRDTMFYEPVAFDVQPTPRIDMPPRAGYTPAEYDLPGFVYAYGSEAPATAPGRVPSAMHAVYVYGNGLGHFFRATDKWQEDDQGPMYFEPARQPDVKGFPVYGKALMVITRSERPIFLPAPLERTMRFVIATNKKGIEGMNAPQQQRIVDRTKACIAKLEQELASLSPADRAGPTYFATTRVPGRDAGCDPFSSASDKNARRIIIENPDFYDRTRPPSDVQVVFVNLGDFNTMQPDQRAQRERVENALDFAAFAALTAKP